MADDKKKKGADAPKGGAKPVSPAKAKAGTPKKKPAAPSRRSPRASGTSTGPR